MPYNSHRKNNKVFSNITRKNKKILSVCSSAIKKNGKTCYSNKALEDMKRIWNMRRPDMKITGSTPTEIWKALRERMSNTCSTERCWIRHKIISSGLDEETLQYTFAPEAPKSWSQNPTEWLTNYDIEKVMSQYEHHYPSFLFIGPTPIDFDTRKDYGKCVWDELCMFDLSYHIRRGKNKIGIVFNTDPHDKDGEHWISVFIDASSKSPFVFFFDSAGDPPPKEVKVLSERILSQARDIGLNMKYYENHPFEHQKGDTECGVYSIYMISEVLIGRKKPMDFMKRVVSDIEMQKLRDKLFNKPL